MAKLTVDGREVEIAPYKLGAMRQAAPWIDKINARSVDIAAQVNAAQALTQEGAAVSITATLEDLTDMTLEFLEVLAVGTSRVDPKMDVDFLSDRLGVGDLAEIRTAFHEVMRESGLGAKGEATAPPAPPKPRGASKTA